MNQGGKETLLDSKQDNCMENVSEKEFFCWDFISSLNGTLGKLLNRNN